MSPVPLSSSYHILTLSVICYWTDASQHVIYLLNVSRALANEWLFHSYFAVSVIQVWRLINCCSGICDYCFLSYIVSCILDYKKLIILLWPNFNQLCSLKLQTVCLFSYQNTLKQFIIGCCLQKWCYNNYNIIFVDSYAGVSLSAWHKKIDQLREWFCLLGLITEGKVLLCFTCFAHLWKPVAPSQLKILKHPW